MEGIDNLLEEAVEGLPLALPFLEFNVCELPCHPAGLGPHVTIRAVKTGHHIVQQQALQVILVGSLYKACATMLVKGCIDAHLHRRFLCLLAVLVG